jgi:triosephosphate isomerase (TIM)
MSKYLVANWKCHKSTEEGKRWFDQFAKEYRAHPDLEVVVAPPIQCLEKLADYIATLKLPQLSLAVQDISPFPRGDYTGAVSADMVVGFVRYAIVGHNERRRYFHETQIEVANKVTEALDAKLIPIVCVDGKEIFSQLGVLEDTNLEQILVAYSPVDALTAKIAEPQDMVVKSVNAIKKSFNTWPVLYGGAIQPGNASLYFSLPGVSGLFVGSASLDPSSFAAICRTVSSSLKVFCNSSV